MAFQEFSKNYLNVLMVPLFQHLLYFLLIIKSYSESVRLSFGSSLQHCHKLPDVSE